MISSYDENKKRSIYHFDNNKFDDRWDTVIDIGCIKPTWAQQEIDELVANSRPETWRSIKTAPERTETQKARAEEELVGEYYDLERSGYKRDHVISHMNWQLPESIVRIRDAFRLEQPMARIHVQKPGETWNLHIDKLYKLCAEDPSRVLRFVVHLTDWELGHFWSYGNHCHAHWKAGDVHTFDWPNVPHSTANAGHVPRASLNLTGLRTPDTEEFLAKLKQSSRQNPLEL